MSVGAAPAASAGASSGASGVSGSSGVAASGGSASVGAVSGGGSAALPAAFSIGIGMSSGMSHGSSAYGMNPANLQSQLDAQNKDSLDKNSPLMMAIAAAMLHKQAFGS